MDPVELQNSCICGTAAPYSACCGRFASSGASIADETERKWAGFRHALHELCMYVFPLRDLHRAYWEKLGRENYPHHLLTADSEYGRALTANFFWDYSVQFSDARPILRAARDIEGRDVRMANDFRQWSLSPFSLGIVEEAGARQGCLRMLGSEKIRRVIHGGDLPEPGACVGVRLLAYRGEEFAHPAMLTFPRDSFSGKTVEAAFHRACKRLGVKSALNLRPDVHCEEWRGHGALFLSLWREQAHDAVIGVPTRNARTVEHPFRLTVSEPVTARQLLSGGAFQTGKNRFEIRHRNVPLAQLDIRKSGIQGQLADEAFRPYVFSWLEDHLDFIPGAPRVAREDSPHGAEDLERWMRRPLSLLNHETPLQAASHDFGKRRLRELVGEMSRRGRDVAMLEQRLGL